MISSSVERKDCEVGLQGGVDTNMRGIQDCKADNSGCYMCLCGRYLVFQQELEGQERADDEDYVECAQHLEPLGGF